MEIAGLVITGTDGLVGGLATALLTVVGLIVRGDLVPRKIHETRIADREVIIDYLKEANAKLIDSTATFARSGETNDKLHTTLDEALQNQEGSRHQ